MTARNYVYSTFFGKMVLLVGEFSGDVTVEALFYCLVYVVAGSAGNNSYSSDLGFTKDQGAAVCFSDF